MLQLFAAAASDSNYMCMRWLQAKDAENARSDRKSTLPPETVEDSDKVCAPVPPCVGDGQYLTGTRFVLYCFTLLCLLTSASFICR